MKHWSRAHNGLPWTAANGRLLRDARTRLGWTQDELAGRADIAQATVSYLERGEHLPSAALLLCLARALKTTPTRFGVRTLTKARKEG